MTENQIIAATAAVSIVVTVIITWWILRDRQRFVLFIASSYIKSNDKFQQLVAEVEGVPKSWVMVSQRDTKLVYSVSRKHQNEPRPYLTWQELLEHKIVSDVRPIKRMPGVPITANYSCRVTDIEGVLHCVTGTDVDDLEQKVNRNFRYTVKKQAREADVRHG